MHGACPLGRDIFRRLQEFAGLMTLDHCSHRSHLATRNQQLILGTELGAVYAQTVPEERILDAGVCFRAKSACVSELIVTPRSDRVWKDPVACHTMSVTSLPTRGGSPAWPLNDSACALTRV